jgi:hypothetical protein
MSTIEKPTRVPFGARVGQRVTAIVLLVIVVLFILGALFAPLFPVGSPSIEDDFGIDHTKMLFVQLAAGVQWFMLVLTIGLTTWFLVKKWPAFYIPIVTGLIAAVTYWPVYLTVTYLRF